MVQKTPIPPEMLEHVAQIFRTLGDASRLEILQTLMCGSCNVGDIVIKTEKGQANVSKHLAVLANAGLVSRHKEGTQVIYHIADPLVGKLCTLVCGSLQERISEDIEEKRTLLKNAEKSSSR